MNYAVIDVGRLLVATFCLVPVIVLPGLAIARLTNLLGFDDAPSWRQWLIGLFAAFALLPWLASIVARFAGSWASLALLLGLAIYGVATLMRSRPLPRLGRLGIACCAIWAAVVVLTSIDVEWRDSLYQSALAVDSVKHAATIQAIADSGLPLVDPFFARNEPASYYYFFYVPAALALKLSGGLSDARATMAAMVFWCGPALFAMMSLVFERCRIAKSAAGAPAVMLLLLAVTGLDIVPLALAGSVGIWYPSMDWWNEEITGWVSSVLWVPHHLAGLMACWLGFAVVADEIEKSAGGERPFPLRSLLVAGAAFASALGSSVWVTLGGVVTALLWLLLLAWERRWLPARYLAAAGAAGIVLAAPFIYELLGNRAYEGVPVALTIRAFSVWDSLNPSGVERYLGRALLLPVNYGLELGAFVLGSVLFWWGRRRADVHRAELSRVVTLGAIAGFMLGTFVKSTIISNDLGFRTMLFLQLATLVWTTAFICERLQAASASSPAPAPFRRVPVTLGLLMLFGAAGTVWGLLALRLYVIPGLHSITYLGTDPKANHALRDAYAWLNARVSANAIVQHDPSPKRVFDFGLYGRNPVAVADKDGNLFGADKRAVRQRVAELSPIFQGSMPASEVRARAEATGISYLVVSRADPVWRSADSWLWQARPVYANDGARIIEVRSLPKDRS